MDRFEFGGWMLGFGAGHTVAVAVRTPDGDLLQCGEVTGEPAQMVAGLAESLLAMTKSHDALRADLQHLRDQAGPDSCADQVIRREAAERQLAEARARMTRTQLVAASANGDMARLLEWLRDNHADVYAEARRALATTEEPTDGE